MGSNGEPAWVATPPSAYNIVSCFFPEVERPKSPGPVLRPALVLAVFRGKETGRFACRVAFGTKNLKIVQRQHLDIIVQNNADIAQFGLGVATRFDLDKLALLPWTSAFFGCWRGKNTPVLGQITESYIRGYAFKMMARRSATRS